MTGWLDEDKASVRATQNTHTCTNNNTYVCIQSNGDNVARSTTTQKTAPYIVGYGA